MGMGLSLGLPLAPVKGVGVPFSPLDYFEGGTYSGLWISGARNDLMRQASGGTGAVSADNDPVGYVISQDPTARVSTQAGSTGARPFWKTTNEWLFDALDDNWLSTLVPSPTFSYAFKVKVPASIPSTQIFMGCNDAASTNRCFAAFSTVGQLCGGVGSQSTPTILGANDWRGQTVTGGLTLDGSTVKLYANSKVPVYSGAQAGVPSSTTPIRIGADNNNGTAANFFGGRGVEFYAINRALSADQIEKLINYWGTT